MEKIYIFVCAKRLFEQAAKQMSWIWLTNITQILLKKTLNRK